MTPDGLASRGAALWEQATKGRTFGPASLVLLEEACRIADRLDGLHRILTTDPSEWLRFRDARDNEAGDVVVVINAALDEARQNANVLRQLIATLGLATAVVTPAAEADDLDEISDRRARRAAASTQ